MISISVDEEVFEFLQSHGEPLVDTPNMVLRRLLLDDSVRVRGSWSRPAADPEKCRRVSTREFGKRVSAVEFGEPFWRVRSAGRGFRTMFESQDRIVYYLNFNKPDALNYLYRLTGQALRALLDSTKQALVVFTNPAEGVAYLVPAQEIGQRLVAADRDLEGVVVNIDSARNLWRELAWDLSEFRRDYAI